MQLKEGSVLQGGKYEIIRTLGQGGFGITYLGRQLGLGREVAIKEFYMAAYCNRGLSSSHVTTVSDGAKVEVERFKRKFLKEAAMIASLDNPHIIHIYDVFEENGTAYYVMEYINGGSLKELLAARGSLPEAEAMKYVFQLSEALRYLHGLKILHLDLKPANILMKDGHTAVLIDFGISKQYDDIGGQTSSTPVGLSKGYAPLEQYMTGGVNNFKPCTDIYALGATFYTLLTGVLPPEASEVNENGLPPLPPSVSGRVVEAIKKAMSPRQKDRPQSVDEFIALFVETSGSENKGKSLSKEAWVACAAALALIVLVVLALLAAKDDSMPAESYSQPNVVASADNRQEAMTVAADSIGFSANEPEEAPSKWGDEKEAVAFARKAILDRLADKADYYSGSDLDDGLRNLLAWYRNDVNDLYGSPDNPVEDGIWHIGNDMWDPSLHLISANKEQIQTLGITDYFYNITFELYYARERQGTKAIKVRCTDNAFSVYDICSDNAESPSSVWVREALSKYYFSHAE